ncbi:MAG: hypothetical protein JO147_04835 [Actinobacteria bacterium]|nr:hypothetical protein [Actinomycetota bacterium]
MSAPRLNEQLAEDLEALASQLEFGVGSVAVAAHAELQLLTPDVLEALLRIARSQNWGNAYTAVADELRRLGKGPGPLIRYDALPPTAPDASNFVHPNYAMLTSEQLAELDQLHRFAARYAVPDDSPSSTTTTTATGTAGTAGTTTATGTAGTTTSTRASTSGAPAPQPVVIDLTGDETDDQGEGWDTVAAPDCREWSEGQIAEYLRRYPAMAEIVMEQLTDTQVAAVLSVLDAGAGPAVTRAVRATARVTRFGPPAPPGPQPIEPAETGGSDIGSILVAYEQGHLAAGEIAEHLDAHPERIDEVFEGLEDDEGVEAVTRVLARMQSPSGPALQARLDRWNAEVGPGRAQSQHAPSAAPAAPTDRPGLTDDDGDEPDLDEMQIDGADS